MVDDVCAQLFWRLLAPAEFDGCACIGAPCRTASPSNRDGACARGSGVGARQARNLHIVRHHVTSIFVPCSYSLLYHVLNLPLLIHGHLCSAPCRVCSYHRGGSSSCRPRVLWLLAGAMAGSCACSRGCGAGLLLGTLHDAFPLQSDGCRPLSHLSRPSPRIRHRCLLQQSSLQTTHARQHRGCSCGDERQHLRGVARDS
mmetsp:Transcript_25130/g.68277  ORF Transcript_25130/g.68277 Transcript_25130/m.68277 type:complete len:200 (+) Transcript_25130:3378-3977(+)